MDDVIAIRVIEENGGSVAFLTWGRLFDPVDPSEILEAAEKSLSTFGIREYTKLKVCDNLGEVAGERYFYEGLIELASQLRDARRHGYKSWRKKMAKRVKAGRGLYFLGRRPPKMEPD
jgi:hypothetical protein